MANASCFSFFRGISANALVSRARLRGVHVYDLSQAPSVFATPPPFNADETAVISYRRWTVVWQENGFPNQFADAIAGSPQTSRAVIAYWNVNALTEFAYWQRGARVVSFDAPDDRTGADPNRLLADMRATVGSGQGQFRSVAQYYGRMLALAQRLTGIHVSPNLFNRSRVILGYRVLD
ncbi:MAG TPA: DUF6461 domain-containing protein [Mycobacterium sp.]|nr:DUF6461 domain-containing protein [Mycobacterium sp.]